MHVRRLATVLGFAVGYAWTTGCSGDDTTVPTSGAGGAAGSTGATTGAATTGIGGAGGAGVDGGAGSGTGGSTAGGAGTGAGGQGPMLLNGCQRSAAVDDTASSMVTITFGDSLMYDPACVRIRTGATVTWVGNFVMHPLQGGTVSGSFLLPDHASPIASTSGSDAGSVSVKFMQAGDFGYYCTVHAAFGMKGAVFVDP